MAYVRFCNSLSALSIVLFAYLPLYKSHTYIHCFPSRSPVRQITPRLCQFTLLVFSLSPTIQVPQLTSFSLTILPLTHRRPNHEQPKP